MHGEIQMCIRSRMNWCDEAVAPVRDANVDGHRLDKEIGSDLGGRSLSLSVRGVQGRREIKKEVSLHQHI